MATPSHPSQIGRYQIQRLIGAGGMGDVYLATDPHIERQLAIKTVRLRGEPAEVADHKRRLLREAKAAGRLVHAHVVTLFDAGEVDGLLYLAFELVDGPDLGRRMKARPPLSLGHSLTLVRQIAEGLDFAHHQGIIHRDIKPSNILIDPRGQAKIADFGLAKLNDESLELTRTGSVVGSPQYMSPEQVRGETLDGRTDIFSLGVLFYELMSSLRPFGGQTISTLVFEILSKEPPPLGQLRPDLPKGIIDLVRDMLAKDLGARVATAGDIVRRLDEVLAATPAALLEAPAFMPIDASAPTELMARTPTPGAAMPPLPAKTPPAVGPPQAPFTGTAIANYGGPPPPPGVVATQPTSSPGMAGPPPPLPPPMAPRAAAASSGALPSGVAVPSSAVSSVSGSTASAAAATGSRGWIWGLAGLMLLLILGVAGWGLSRWWVSQQATQTATVAATSGQDGEVAAGVGPTETADGSSSSSAAPANTTPPVSGTTTSSPSSRDPERPADGGGDGASPSRSAPRGVSETSGTRGSEEGRPVTAPSTTPPPPPSRSSTPPPPASTSGVEEQRTPSSVPRNPPSQGTQGASPPPAGAATSSNAPSLPPPPATSTAVDPEIAAFDAAAAEAHREMNSGRFFKFLIDPSDAVVRLWRRGEERQLVLGQAQQYNAKDRDGRSVELPDDGDYLFTFISDGHPDFLVLVHATSGGGSGPQVIRAALGTATRQRGGPERLRVSRSLSFEGQPSDATVFVDGKAEGPASNWPGGLRAVSPRNLQLRAGRHRLRIEAEGYEPYEILVEVSPAGPRSAVVNYDLQRRR